MCATQTVVTLAHFFIPGLETKVGMVLDLDWLEIQAPVTLCESQGTNIFGPKISSHHPEMMIFNAYLGFVMQKDKVLKMGGKEVIFKIFPHYTA